MAIANLLHLGSLVALTTGGAAAGGAAVFPDLAAAYHRISHLLAPVATAVTLLGIAIVTTMMTMIHGTEALAAVAVAEIPVRVVRNTSF